MDFSISVGLGAASYRARHAASESLAIRMSTPPFFTQSAAPASAAGAAAFMKGLPKRQLPEYSGPQGQDQQPKPPKLRDFAPPKPPPPWWMPDGLSDILP